MSDRSAAWKRLIVEIELPDYNIEGLETDEDAEVAPAHMQRGTGRVSPDRPEQADSAPRRHGSHNHEPPAVRAAGTSEWRSSVVRARNGPPRI